LVQELVIIRPKKIVVLGSVAKQCVEKMVHVMAMKGNVVYLPHPSSIKTKEEALGFSRAFVEAIKWKSSS
jgi:uracil-DNA glycosylase